MENIKTPQTWEELVSLKEYLTDCPGDALRLPHHQKVYNLFRKYVPREEVMKNIHSHLEQNDIDIIPNDFPYTLVLKKLPKVTHYCLWSKKGPLTTRSINREITLHFPTNRWFYSERKPGHKSVPEIWHCHVFIEER